MGPAQKARWDLANKKMERKAGKLLMMTIAPLLLNFVGMAMGQNSTLITAITKIGLQLGWQNEGGWPVILMRTSGEHTYSNHYLQPVLLIWMSTQRIRNDVALQDQNQDPQ